MRKLSVTIVLATVLFVMFFPVLFGKETRSPVEIITIEPGNRFMIKLESNRTTGFQWQLGQPLDKSKLQLLRTEYITSNPKIIGGEGKEVWVFKALAPGRAVIVFKYVRPWEKEESEPKTKSFVVLIREDELLENNDWTPQSYE
ncbi:MAG: protease inhibitor I42 family protein [Candidatus Omnitrophota bacterium]